MKKVTISGGVWNGIEHNAAATEAMDLNTNRTVIFRAVRESVEWIADEFGQANWQSVKFDDGEIYYYEILIGGNTFEYHKAP